MAIFRWKKWNLLIDKSGNKTDVPHDYIELAKPVEARYIKLENIHMPTGKFAISGLRIFWQWPWRHARQREKFFSAKKRKRYAQCAAEMGNRKQCFCL